MWDTRAEVSLPSIHSPYLWYASNFCVWMHASTPSQFGFAGAYWVTPHPDIANQSFWLFRQEWLVQEWECDPIRGSKPQGALLKFAGQQTLASPKFWETEASTPI